jgi:hypothetical protein
MLTPDSTDDAGTTVLLERAPSRPFAFTRHRSTITIAATEGFSLPSDNRVETQ